MEYFTKIAQNITEFVRAEKALKNHLVRRYGKINDDMRKTLILSHFLMVS